MVRLGKPALALGRQGEKIASDYLVSHGYEILTRNWRCQHGEIDIVAREKQSGVVAIVEVKTRTGHSHGAPLEAITYTKAARLYQLAMLWLQETKVRSRRIRVDGIGIEFGEGSPDIVHIKGIAA